MSIEEALERFLVQLQADGRSVHTVAQYARHVRALGAWTATEGLAGEVERVGHETLARFLASPAARTRGDGRPKRAASMNAMRASVKGYFQYLARVGIVAQDSSQVLRRAHCGPPPPRGMAPEDERRLRTVLAKGLLRDQVLYGVMLDAGVRVGSAVGMDVDDVDLDEAEIRTRSVKGDREAVVFLPSALRAPLEKLVARRRTGPLFVGRAVTRLSGRHVHRRLGTLLERAGVRRRYSPHSLRHAFALRLYARTGDVLLVQAALGHRSITSTTVYARASDERVRAALGA